MKIAAMLLPIVFSIVGLQITEAGEPGGKWPTSLAHPLTGKLGGSYTASAGGTFMDPNYNVGVRLKSEWREHVGVDIPAAIGTKVYAIADGYDVTSEGSDINLRVEAIHQIGGKTLRVIYGHIKKSSVGSTIKRGQEIGTIVASPLGAHIHFGVFEGKSYSQWVSGKEWGWGRVPLGTSATSVERFGWRDPVPFLRKLDVVSPGLIEVSGTKVIKDGDTSASSTDGTSLSGRRDQSIRFSFKIKNVGKGSLNITSCYLANANSGFTITSSPNSSVPAGGVTAVEIEFRSKSKGSNYADVIIRSNSESSSEFDFEIKAKVE